MVMIAEGGKRYGGARKFRINIDWVSFLKRTKNEVIGNNQIKMDEY